MFHERTLLKGLLVAGLFVLMAALAPLHAQDTTSPSGSEKLPTDTVLQGPPVEIWRAGAFVAAGINIHTAEGMRGLPGVPSCCPGYGTGLGFSPAIGALAEVPLDENWAFGFRTQFGIYDGTLRDREEEVVDSAGEAVTATFEHSLASDIWGISLEPIAILSLSRQLKVFTGFRGDLLVKKNFEQSERIISPENIYFENDLRERFVFDGKIPNANGLLASVLAGVRYEFPATNDTSLVLAPELVGWYGFTPIVKDSPWRIHGVRLGVSAQFIKYRQPEIMPALIPRGPVLSPGTESDDIDVETPPPVPTEPEPPPGTDPD